MDKDFFHWKTRFFVASDYEAPSLLRMTSFHHYHLDSVLVLKGHIHSEAVFLYYLRRLQGFIECKR